MKMAKTKMKTRGREDFAAGVGRALDEGLWYTAHLCLIDLRAATTSELHVPRDQLGCRPHHRAESASRSSRRSAVIAGSWPATFASSMARMKALVQPTRMKSM